MGLGDDRQAKFRFGVIGSGKPPCILEMRCGLVKWYLNKISDEMECRAEWRH